MAQLGEGAAHGVVHIVGGFTVMGLVVAADQRDCERGPPQGGDDETGACTGRGAPAECRRTGENQRDASDERDGGADISPSIAVRGDLVHAVVGGGVDEHGIVEGERTVEPDGGKHAYREERNPAQRQCHRAAGEDAGAEEADEESDLHARHVGDGAQNRHKQRDDEGCYGLHVPPSGHDVGFAGGFEQGVRVDGDDGGGQQNECGIADIVEHPLLFAVVEVVGVTGAVGGGVGRC